MRRYRHNQSRLRKFDSGHQSVLFARDWRRGNPSEQSEPWRECRTTRRHQISHREEDNQSQFNRSMNV